EQSTDPYLSNLTSEYVDYGQDAEYNCSRVPKGWMVLAGVCLGISACGLIGNSLVLWFLSFQVKLNHFTTYMLHLAVADFSLVLLFFVLMLAALSFTLLCRYNFFPFYNDLVSVVEFLCHFFDLSSLALLTAISVERGLSVV
ncbi:MAS protein, partial [Semnornis frantzii]|nr:MAS protein [Semnornis frantzii]